MASDKNQALSLFDAVPEELLGEFRNVKYVEPPADLVADSAADQAARVAHTALSVGYDVMSPSQERVAQAWVPRSATKVSHWWAYAEVSSGDLGEEWRNFNTHGQAHEWIYWWGMSHEEIADGVIPGVKYSIRCKNQSGNRNRALRYMAQYEYDPAKMRPISAQITNAQNTDVIFKMLLPDNVRVTGMGCWARDKVSDEPWGPWKAYDPSGGLVAFYSPFRERPTSPDPDRRRWNVHTALFKRQPKLTQVFFAIEYEFS